jgi:hypothetical protein
MLLTMFLRQILAGIFFVVYAVSGLLVGALIAAVQV